MLGVGVGVDVSVGVGVGVGVGVAGDPVHPATSANRTREERPTANTLNRSISTSDRTVCDYYCQVIAGSQPGYSLIFSDMNDGRYT